jgi:DNA-binding transcriptional LysR family regulator
MSLDLKHLRCFVAVAEELNFSVAARRLYISQQALSRIIQHLERELGTTLLERTTRSVRLTTAGQAMLTSARRSLAAVDATFDEARRLGNGDPVPRLRVDVSSSGLQTGAEILRRMRRHHPDIAVLQVEDGVPRGRTALVEGRLDALLGLAERTPGNVYTEPVRNEALQVGMAVNHPLTDLDVVPMAKLADFPLLLPAEAAAPEWIRFVQNLCRQAGITARTWPGNTHGSVGAAEVVREGGCVVPTTAWAAPPADLEFRPLVEPTPVFPWSMMLAPETVERPEVAAFADCVRTARAELDWLTVPG